MSEIEQLSKAIELSNANMQTMLARHLYADSGTATDNHLAMANRIATLKARYLEELWQAASGVLDKIPLEYDATEEEIADATAAIADAMSAWHY